jgi:hypothetical protein
MDRSFLSHADVIAASRNFVCVRLTSYEDDAESAFCRSLMVGRSGEVENTTFTILAPDGETKLVRAFRATRGLFTDAADMARQMNSISAKYPGNDDRATPPLPLALDARIGLDIAACDNRPLIVIVASAEPAREELESRVASIAWSTEFIGTFVYAAASSAKEVVGVTGIPAADGIAIIEPDAFGQSGRLMQFISSTDPNEHVAKAMRRSLSTYHMVAKNRQSHRFNGMKNGSFWETKFPVTDPEEANARERTKKEIERRRKDG